MFSSMPSQMLIDKMVFASAGSKLSMTSFSYQPPMIGLIRSATFVMIDSPQNVIGLWVSVAGIQLSSHTMMFAPSPTLQTSPFLSRVMPLRIICQVHEIPDEAVASIILPAGKYLARSTLPTNDSGSCKSLYPCRASMPILKIWRSLKPRPPSLFGFYRHYQPSQWCLSSSWLFHQ